jgi:hypothetical protein
MSFVICLAAFGGSTGGLYSPLKSLMRGGKAAEQHY